MMAARGIAVLRLLTIQTEDSMDPISAQSVLATAGAAGAGDATYVDDVFSTFLYEGNNSTQTINNGIDLSGEGGLVWQKGRSMSSGSWSIPHLLYDTERGTRKLLSSSSSDAESTPVYGVSSFNSNGFSLNDSYTHSNSSVIDGGYCSWTFRKAPGFFDVVTYTGSGSVQNISHNLGSVPGMILIKNLDTQYDWAVYHRSTGNSIYLRLNTTAASASSSSYWNNTTPTSTHFTIGTNSTINQSGASFVAYIFAHDDARFGTNEDESVISCGTFNATSGTQVNIGWEPQFLLAKNVTSANDWSIVDTMRGFTADSDNYLLANKAQPEYGYPLYAPTPTGFTVSFTANNDAYIYMAIRSPHKP